MQHAFDDRSQVGAWQLWPPTNGFMIYDLFQPGAGLVI